MTADLFADQPSTLPARVVLAPGALLLRGFASTLENELIAALHQVTHAAPFRHMETPGGFRMSVAISNCGALGWVSDRRGYRYAPLDPLSQQPWPAMPEVFAALAASAAAQAGYRNFVPDAALVNRYALGAQVSLHQDRNEQDFRQPIVSISLGLPATFLFGGEQRSDKTRRIGLLHGDVAVWGGPSRLHYHGIVPLKAGVHPQLGAFRYNITLRKAG